MNITEVPMGCYFSYSNYRRYNRRLFIKTNKINQARLIGVLSHRDVITYCKEKDEYDTLIDTVIDVCIIVPV